MNRDKTTFQEGEPSDIPLSEDPLKPPILLVFAGNPTPYHAPLFRGISNALDGRLLVMFGGSFGIRPFFNPEVQSVISWDISPVGGYPYKVFRNFSRDKSRTFFRWNNPSIFFHVLFSPASHVLLHGYDTLSSWYVYFAALVSRKSIIWRGETVERKRSSPSLKSVLKSLILPLYFRGCSKVLYSCIKNKQYLQKYLPDNSSKLVAFPCAVDNAFFEEHRLKEIGEKSALRQEYGVPKEHMLIMSCCRLTERKRVDLIINSLSEMNEKNVSFLLIGDGPEKKTLIQQAAALNINLICTGFVGQYKVARLLSLADVFVLMSSYDASPKALNEAATYSIPLIVSEGVGTSEDLIQEGINGYVIRVGEESRLTGCLDLLASNPKKRKLMGEKTKDIIKNYSIDSDLDGLREAMKNDG